MDIKTFSILSTMIVPLAMIAVLALAGWLLPRRITKNPLFQSVVVVWLVGIIALPVSAIHFDAQGDFFDDRNALVREGLGMPAQVEVAHKKYNNLGDCWSNSVDWSVEAKFPSQEDRDAWLESEAYREPLIDQISSYFDIPIDQINVRDGALNLAEMEPRWRNADVRDLDKRYISRRYGHWQPFVCVAIERADPDANTLTLRRCDPVMLPEDNGNMGRVILNRQGKAKILEGHIFYASGPAYCSNPVRRAVNSALGLPHPEARRVEDGANLPIK